MGFWWFLWNDGRVCYKESVLRVFKVVNIVVVDMIKFVVMKCYVRCFILKGNENIIDKNGYKLINIYLFYRKLKK